MVQQPIEDRGRDDLITVGAAFSEGVHLAPLLDGAVGGDQHAAELVAAGRLELAIPLRFHNHAREQLATLLAFH